MSDVKDFLKKCSEAYYAGTPIIGDEEFDYLAELHNFEEVGASPTKNKVKHLYRMYSLQKVYEEDGVSISSQYVKTSKLDGSAISLLYIDGKLDKVITRGDGIIGEDITSKFFTNKRLVPLEIGISGVVQITGEIVAPISIPNARNYASGALHLKDLDEFIKRDIRFIAYGIYPFVESNFTEDMTLLYTEGFSVVTEQDYKEYPHDGVVYRLNNNAAFMAAGFTAKHPKGAIAVKKRSDVEVVETKLLDVVWQLGKGGKVTPVAILDTITIGGANISRATLHNAGFIENLDLDIGDTLLITRSGGIIPKVVGKL